ncbi:MAG: alpha/beta hydrolase [Verrucomicrobiota bacterium]
MTGELRNAAGERLDYTFHAAANRSTNRVALIGHGLTGNKDRPWAVALGKALSEADIPALRFSFAGNGESEGRFEDCTITKEVADLGTVIDAVTPSFTEVVYVGHSMGGAVGVIRASHDDRIKRLVSLAGMVHTKRFCEEEFGEVTPGEGTMWEDEDCPLSQAFVDDLTTIGSVLPLGPGISVPWCFVHGTEDDIIPIAEGRELFATASEPKEWNELPETNHVFADDPLPMTQAVAHFLS